MLGRAAECRVERALDGEGPDVPVRSGRIKPGAAESIGSVADDCAGALCVSVILHEEGHGGARLGATGLAARET